MDLLPKVTNGCNPYEVLNNFIEEKNQPPISISNQRNNCNFNFSRKENNDLNDNNNFVGIIPNKQQNKLIRYIMIYKHVSYIYF